jgi:adenylate kinase
VLLFWRWPESLSRSSLATDFVGVKRRLVLLGPPASGKGTQAELIQNRFGIPTTSTGAILRKQAKERTSLGLEAEKIISKGGLAPDSLVMQVVEEWLETHPDAFLFDGFPRTVEQAKAFDAILQGRQRPLDLAIALAVSVETIRTRMALRLVCANCGKVVSMGRHVQSSRDPCPNCGGPLEKRSDDNHEALERRLEAYWEKTVPVYKYYGSLLVEIEAGRDVEAVFADIGRLIQDDSH